MIDLQSDSYLASWHEQPCSYLGAVNYGRNGLLAIKSRILFSTVQNGLVCFCHLLFNLFNNLSHAGLEVWTIC